MKILIIRFSSIGDIVLTTPVIRCIKKQVPNAQVHFATKSNFKSFMESNPYIDKLHLLNKNDAELIKELQAENFDAVIDLHNNLRTFRIKWALGLQKASSFNKLNLKKWLWTNLGINRMPKQHIVDRYLAAAQHLGVKNDHEGLNYFIPEKDKDAAKKFDLPSNYSVYCIGGQHATKKLPQAKMRELAQNISEPIVLLGGPEDQAEGELLAQYFKKTDPSKVIIDLCGKCNLNQSASITQQASMVYTHDTGMMHIAAALKKPIIAIWGNTHPDLGMYPYQTTHWNIQNTALNCRPCSKIGHKKCPKGHFNCMNQLSFDQLPIANQ
jgi:lipopolysaccharide heptosyltransferase II